jgi:antitoxin ParD1/3/4
MNISMPANMRRYVEERVRAGQYNNTSEFIRELIRKDREERQSRAQVWLEQELLPAIEALERGELDADTPEFWRGIRQEVQERLAQTRATAETGA